MSKRMFTPAEANRTLPLVKRIVEDILAHGQKLKQILDEHGQEGRFMPAFRELATGMEELMAELEGVGCSYRDWNFEIGLVDFPAMIDGQEVLLCWRSDEPSVAWYHGVNAGYAGRTPIPAALLDEQPSEA